jgi:hypothetical protein
MPLQKLKFPCRIVIANMSNSSTRSNSAARRNNTSSRWYKIPEITPENFYKCCKDIYKVLDEQHTSKTSEDPFLKAVLKGNTNMQEDTWAKAEKVRLAQKSLEGKMGDFHEELMGKFPGYVTYPVGHSTGCDVGSTDGNIVMEIKNRQNTMNSSSAEAVINKLKKNKAEGRDAILVEVNCPNGKVNRFGAPENIKVWNGKTTYAFLSGRESFFDDLLSTLQYVFANFKTYAELKRGLGIA